MKPRLPCERCHRLLLPFPHSTNPDLSESFHETASADSLRSGRKSATPIGTGLGARLDANLELEGRSPSEFWNARKCGQILGD